MKLVEKWQAKDGTLFDSSEACSRHESKLPEETKLLADAMIPYRKELLYGNGGMNNDYEGCLRLAEILVTFLDIKPKN